MKVHILALHLAFGGVEKAITNMANIFVERYEVEIICLYDMPDAPAYPLDERVKVTYLLKDIPNRDAFKAAVKRKNPFLVLKEGIKATRILHMKKAKLIETIKAIQDGIVITTRHEDSLLLSKYGNPKVFKIAQLHHDHKLDPSFMNAFAKEYQNIDVFCLLTEQLKIEVEKILPKNNKMECTVVANFVDHIPELPKYSTRKKQIVATGRMHEVKGFDRLLVLMEQIHQQCSDWKLILIGDGDEYASLKTYVETHHMESYVEMVGQLSSEQIEAYNLESSLYLMTSHSEGLPYVLIEAQSCGLPIIAFDVRVGPRAVIEQGCSGYLIPDKDQQAFVETTVSLLKDDALRETMSNAAYIQSQRYVKKKIAEQWFSILEKANDR